MNIKLIRLFFLCVMALGGTTVGAQVMPADEYRAEIGITGGGSYYLGDANGVLFNNMQAAYGGFFRYVFNPRTAMKVELLGTNVSNPAFENNFVFTGDVNFEFNFFDLERNPYKRFSKTFSPYIFAGIGGLTDVYDGQFLPVMSLPFGVGMKAKLGKRWNLNVQWTTRLLFSDYLENTVAFNNPNDLNGSNFLNNDFLSTFAVGLSYDIWKKDCDCINNNYNTPRKGRKK